MAGNFWIFHKHWPLGSPEHKLPQKRPISFYDLFICLIFQKKILILRKKQIGYPSV